MEASGSRAISASASVDGTGKLHITLSNANPHKDIAIKAYVRGLAPSRVAGRPACRVGRL